MRMQTIEKARLGTFVVAMLAASSVRKWKARSWTLTYIANNTIEGELPFPSIQIPRASVQLQYDRPSP